MNKYAFTNVNKYKQKNGMYSMKYFLILLFLTSANSINLCVNCKHFKGSFFGNQYGTCAKLTKVKDENNEYVDGSFPIKKIENEYCSVARKYDHLCGKEGKFFETN